MRRMGGGACTDTHRFAVMIAGYRYAPPILPILFGSGSAGLGLILNLFYCRV